jgi:hypothetical protein
MPFTVLNALKILSRLSTLNRFSLEPSYTFANGEAAWLGNDGQWGWVDTVRAEAEPASTNDCLYCGQLAAGMQQWGPALEQSMEIMWAADDLLVGGVTSLRQPVDYVPGQKLPEELVLSR